MADATASGVVLNALLRGLSAQGQEPLSGGQRRSVHAFPIKGPIDLVALAEEVESALGGATSEEEQAKTPAELNAANDG